MRRREFLTAVGSAAASSISGSVSWPRAANAQQAATTVGMLHSRLIDQRSPEVAMLRRGLAESGHPDGSVAIEIRWAEQRDRLPALAAELVRKPVGVIVCNGVSALATKPVVTTVPIVFVTGTDPVRDGLVASFNRPGGNVTGISFLSGSSGGKRLELMRQLVPGVATVGLLSDPRTNEGTSERRDLEAAAQAVGQRLLVVEVRNDREIEAAFQTMTERGAGALLIGSGAFFTGKSRSLAALALRHKLPASHAQRGFADVGGLMSYGSNVVDAYRQGGVYAGRILKGEKPADLPVLQATKFELVVNMATAKALGLTVPMQIHAAADEVIE